MTREEVISKLGGEYMEHWEAVNYLRSHDAEQRQQIEQQAAEIARLREALENIVEGEGLWTKNDMADEARQVLKEQHS